MKGIIAPAALFIIVSILFLCIGCGVDETTVENIARKIAREEAQKTIAEYAQEEYAYDDKQCCRSNNSFHDLNFL